MNIIETPIKDIQPYGKNAKKHPDKQVQQIADSIQTFGWAQPIVVDKDKVIIAGHGRYAAAHFLGLQTVPVLMLNLSEDKAKAYRLADNKLNESAWDDSILIAELKELDAIGFNIELTGFSRSLILQTDEKDDRVPATPDKPKSKLGDLYELGGNRLLCGDATSAEDMIRLMGKVKADMIFTDPPYNVNYNGSGKNTDTKILNDKMSDANFLDFLVATFKNARTAIKGGAGSYVFHSNKTQATFEKAILASEFEIRTQLIWNKPSAGLGAGDYRTKHEPFFYCNVKGTSPNFYGDRTNTTVLDFTKTEEQLASWAKKVKQAERDGKMTIWTMKREPVSDYVHPTQKPVELIMYALSNSSKVDDVVLDPFLGSGSTLIGCQKTNRNCYGMELDPRFVDVIVQRWCDFTENRNIIKNGDKIVW